jgi:glucose-1-phosphate thymidylyltransferase
MFLPMGERTVIDRIFEQLEADDRFDEVFVSTNDRFAEEFDSYLDDRPFEKPTLSVEDTTEESEKFGVVGALAQLVDREGINEDTVVIAGDNLISFEISDFVDFFRARNAPTIAAYDVGSRERASSYGLVELDGDVVVDFQEKPDEPKSTLVSIACYAFTAETVGLLDEYLAEDNNPDEPGWFVQWLQNREPTYAYTFEGAWYDIGTADSYLDAVAWHLDGDAVVAEDAAVDNADIGENVHVMAGAEIRNASLDRTVIFEEASVRSADLRGSILDEHARVEDADLSGSLLGQHSQVIGDER